MVDNIFSQIENAPIEQQRELLDLANKISEKEAVEAARSSFLAFVKFLMPTFIEGRHHRIMADEIDKIISGDLKRLIVTLPPRHSKSLFASVYLPAFYMGHYPSQFIIQASHNADLAQDFGRDVRNLVATERYQKVFPKTVLQPDTKAAGRWNTTLSGKYYSIGVSGKLAGKGANLLILDDIHSEQDYIRSLGGDTEAFDSAFEWYQTGPRQRLQPSARMVVVMCMTGDTPVLMADGTEKPLSDICKGDRVATYDDGRISTSVVNNHRSSGLDSVYTVQTQSGRKVRANKRHPFLVERNGEESWVRVQHLRAGDILVSLKDAQDPQAPRQGRVNAMPVDHWTTTTASIRTPSAALSGFMVSGRAKSASVAKQFTAKAYARDVTARLIRHPSQHQGNSGQGGSGIATELRWSGMRKWLKSAITGVTYAAKSLLPRTLALTGAGSCALTIATTQEGFAGYCAMTATSPLATGNHQKPYSAPPSTCGITRDVIESITPAGRAEVFDIEVDRTENFIANGLISHNTRWHQRDLVGRLVQRMTSNPKADQWKIIEFPAIFDSGKPLWPEFWTLEELERTQAELSAQQWSAQYLQRPTSETTAIIKRNWWQTWPHKEPPKCEYVIQSWDTAYLKPDHRKSKHKKPDYSARTDWGIFYTDNDEGIREPNIILLDAWKKQVEFPQLKIEAKKAYDEVKPDVLLVEAKASGIPLVQELRMAGIPATDVGQSRGSRANPNDKISRVHNVADIFKQGKVWRPERKFAEEVVEECAAFPSGDFDDFVDTMTQALQLFRKGGFISLKTDEDDDDWFPKKKADYY